MEEQKRILKISLKTLILIVFIIVAILIGFSLIIYNHSEKNTTTTEKIVSEIENINQNKNKKYDTIEYIGEDGIIGVTIYKGDKTEFELVKFNGETICNFGEFEYNNHINHNLILINKDNLYKVIDTKGNIIFEEISISEPQIISDNEQDKFISFQKDGKVKIINLESREILSNYEYEDVCNYKTANGLIKVIKDGKYGFIDEKGNIIINFEYENLADSFVEDIIIARKDGKCGCIDKNGNTVINFEYDRIGKLSEGLLSAKKGNKIGFIDRQGNIVIDFQYDYVIDNEEYFKNEFSFFMDMPEFREDVTLVFKDDSAFYIDKFGNKSIYFETRFDITNISDMYFKNGILIAENSEKYGIFNKNGKLIVDFIYEEIQNYGSIELLSVKSNNKWGCIDNQGNIVINFEYDNSLNFDTNFDNIIDKYVIIESNNKYGCIDKNGNTLVEFKYDGLMKTANDNLLLAVNNGKIGFINLNGKIIIDYKYDEFSFYNTEFTVDSQLGLKQNLLGAFREGENWYILDINGNIMGTYKCKSK